MNITQLQNTAVSSLAYAQKFLPYIIETCTKYEILSPARQLCFLAQVSHESGGLFYTEELASGIAYEGRKDLGNIHPGDGPKFRGRGLIQITGRNNYELLGIALGVNFVDNPSLLSAQNINVCSPDQLKYAALSAGWFWNREELNALADHINLFAAIDEGQNLEYFKEITRKINGGYNGLPDRLHRYKAGLNQFLASIPAHVGA